MKAAAFSAVERMALLRLLRRSDRPPHVVLAAEDPDTPRPAEPPGV
jgi:hypothetical protein